MRNKQLQEKLEELLAELKTQPDDMKVVRITDDGFKTFSPIGLYLVDDEGLEVEGDAKADRIVLNI